jgi:HD-GYP domain-containing protein (c-di-GMP phosphodiesterase class II)
MVQRGRPGRVASTGIRVTVPMRWPGKAHRYMSAIEQAVAEVVARKLFDVIRLRDPALAAHMHRTAEVAAAIGAELGCSVDTLDHLSTASHLHDVGKLAVAEEILWKPAGLTRSEWRMVRIHPLEGHRLIADVMNSEISAIVLHHHERMDGEGYPGGLDGQTLSMAVRIVQVADAFDAITSDRPFRPALPVPMAVAEVLRCAGTQFDFEAAAALAVLFEGRADRRPPVERRHVPPFLRTDASPEEVPRNLIRLRGRPA